MSGSEKHPRAVAQALHEDIVAYIDQAEALVDGGRPAALTGLDTAIDALCRRVLALESGDSTRFAAELETLLARLNALQEKMRQAMAACEAGMDELGKRHKAAKAYRTPKETK